MLKLLALGAGDRRFDPWPCYTKDIKNVTLAERNQILSTDLVIEMEKENPGTLNVEIYL